MLLNCDALEFLTVLCTKYDYIKSIVEHQATFTCHCNSCGYIKVVINTNIFISINNLKKKSYNLDDLIKSTFLSHWCQIFDKLCKYCERNDTLYKNELVSTKEILIIYLISYYYLSSEDNKLVKISYKFS